MKATTTNSKELLYIKALNYGPSGIGKTTSIGTLNEKTCLVVICDRNAVPLRHRAYQATTLESWNDFRRLFKILRSRDPEDTGLVLGEVKTLVIDSLSALSDFCKEDIVQVARPGLMADRSGGKSDKPKGIYDEQLSMEDWGLYRTRMTQMLGAFCDLPYHGIMTALEAWTEDKRTGAQYLTPNLNGKLAHECPAYFDLVLHMEASIDADNNNPIRVWKTAHDGKCIAKDASGALNPFEIADWSVVFKKILSNGKAKPE